MYTEKGFVGIPGLPDGWRLIRIGCAKAEDWYVGRNGKPTQWNQDFPTTNMYAIICKIEPKYRPFENAEEADQFWNAALRFINPHAGHEKSRFRINTIGHDGITIGVEFYSYGAAFNKFCVDDGTPFGVKIDE